MSLNTTNTTSTDLRRVAITGMAGITAFGNDWAAIKPRLQARRNAVVRMPDWDSVAGLNTRLAAPIPDFTLPPHYTRVQTRAMGRVAQLSTVATEFALARAGLLGDPVLTSGRTGIAYGSSTGSTASIRDFGRLLNENDTGAITATTYVRMMPHTTAANTGLFFGIRGRLIPTSSACTSGSQAIGYAAEAIRHGYQTVMVAGGAEELCVSEAVVFDTVFATSQRNDAPSTTPRPFDRNRDGLVIGEGAATFILEDYEHARARGAAILGEILAFATNCDATHITQPNRETMQTCIQSAIAQSGLAPSDIGFISAHGTATDRGDIAESHATHALFGDRTPIASLKSYFGHTLGACGALETWLTLEMARDGWFAPTINLDDPDPACAPLRHVTGSGLHLDTAHIMSNNFAFGGVNTSLIIRRTQ
ncbi:beta-ketoacyl-ACP synthase [Geminisphaera colitermitum]|uniref:beta-ketoacyl-ACP synthase n=1 Tax=Geminisphaera colitermitum TaxID=1148786 RepID=UPI000158CAB7|nr:beta-ketoacyl-ACP synthase [Geminisphaera colitermitum]